MNKGFEFWGMPGGEHVSGAGFARQERQLQVIRAGGARVCFGGKGGSKAPAPDPNIGKAALKEAELGQKWYEFADRQFNEGNVRQKDIDAQAKKVADSQLASQAKAEQWSQQDRDIAEAYRKKFDAQSDADRATGLDYRGQFDALGKQATAEGDAYRDKFDQLGASALADGLAYRDKFNQQGDAQTQFGAEQQQRYKDTYQPMEDQFAADAKNWDSAERQDKMAAEVRGDVLSSSAAQQQQQQRDMASMGVDPRSGRFAGVDRGTSAMTALAAAGAQNSARDVVRTQGMALRGDAINMGRGVQAMASQASNMGMQANAMGQAAGAQGTATAMQAQAAGQTAAQQGRSQQMQAQNLGLAATGVGNTAAQLGMSNQNAGYGGMGLGINAGSAAMGTSLGAQQAWMANNQQMSQGFQGGIQGYQASGQTLQSQYNGQLSAHNSDQAASSANSAGLMSGVGAVAGAALMVF